MPVQHQQPRSIANPAWCSHPHLTKRTPGVLGLFGHPLASSTGTRIMSNTTRPGRSGGQGVQGTPPHRKHRRGGRNRLIADATRQSLDPSPSPWASPDPEAVMRSLPFHSALTAKAARLESARARRTTRTAALARTAHASPQRLQASPAAFANPQLSHDLVDENAMLKVRRA